MNINLSIYDTEKCFMGELRQGVGKRAALASTKDHRGPKDSRGHLLLSCGQSLLEYEIFLLEKLRAES